MTDPMATFVAAARRLPAYHGLAWRAADFELTAPFRSDAPIPASRDLRVATENFRAPGAHLFISTAGRDLGPFSAHPSSQEIVFLPGAIIAPATGLFDVEDLRVQVVVELPDPGAPVPPAPSVEQIGDLVRAARATGEIAVVQPGRYGA